jgi:pimeloyl-ACP methyl ester carboxylesterase
LVEGLADLGGGGGPVGGAGGVAGGLLEGADEDVGQRAAGVRQAGAALLGPDDPFFRIDLGRRLAATYPRARLVEVPAAGTFLALDQPDRLAAEIVAFLDET